MENTAVIYARFSCEKQTEQSIEGQVKDCTAFALKNGYTIIKEYIDRALTGRSDDRGSFQQMIADAKKGAFDTVLVWKLDRFARNRIDSAKYKSILALYNVRVVSAMEPIPEGPEGILLESLLEGMAEYYSADLRQKTMRGMRQSAEKCRYNGSGLSLGYYVDKEKHYHVDAGEAELVQKIFAMFISGQSKAEIARWLNDHGYQTKRGASFKVGGISRILENRQYIGEYKWSDVVIENGMPRIIDDETFEKAQNMPSFRGSRKRRPNMTDIFLLTGKLFCGKCLEPMTGDSGTSKTGAVHHYYTCNNKKKGSCTKARANKSNLENLVVDIVVNDIFTDDLVEQLADRIMESQAAVRDNPVLNSYKKKLDDCTKAINNIIKAIERGVISDDLNARLDELQKERVKYEQTIQFMSAEKPAVPREAIVEFINKYRHGDQQDFAFRKKIVDVFVNKVILYDNKIRIFCNFSPLGADNKEPAELAFGFDEISAGFTKKSLSKDKDFLTIFACGELDCKTVILCLRTVIFGCAKLCEYNITARKTSNITLRLHRRISLRTK